MDSTIIILYCVLTYIMDSTISILYVIVKLSYIYIYIYVLLDVWHIWETENYHVMWWFLTVLQSGDCLLIYVHSKTITRWGKLLTTITSHDSFIFPITGFLTYIIFGSLEPLWPSGKSEKGWQVAEIKKKGKRKLWIFGWRPSRRPVVGRSAGYGWSYVSLSIYIYIYIYVTHIYNMHVY